MATKIAEVEATSNPAPEKHGRLRMAILLSTCRWSRLSKSITWCGAIETMTRALAVDLAPIRVNNISHGAIRTPMLEKPGEEATVRFAPQQLVQNVGKVEEIAEAYLFSMRCSVATGQKFTIDGGCTYKWL